MDNKGYTFTPLAVLLVIPIMILAASYGDIANEINNLSQIVIGGDVTYSTAHNIITIMEKTAQDSGRNAAYRATREVIDKEASIVKNPFLTDGRYYIKVKIAEGLNNNVIEACKSMETETGRNITINGQEITNQTRSLFSPNDIEIYQNDPFGFWVKLKPGIPITVTQTDQNFTGYTPPNIVTYVSIEGLEDPYVWVNSKHRRSNIIYKYRYYESYMGSIDYHFADDNDDSRLYRLWDCLNGTNNTSGMEMRPYYFLDPQGLTFFDRLENKTNNTSPGPNSAKMSTFILGEPLYEEFGARNISCLDHEYFNGVLGSKSIYMQKNKDWFRDPMGRIFFISNHYYGVFNLKDKYN